MASNIMNEHIESDHIQSVIHNLKLQGYDVDKEAFVAGMCPNEQKTAADFYVIIE